MARPNNTVVVCPVTSTGRGCPDGGDILRQSVTTGEVVTLQGDCVPNESGYVDLAGLPCFLDECVPPGTYRYGFGSPFGCFEWECYADFYGEIAVATPVDECVRELGSSPPAPGGTPPWTGSGQRICTYSPPSWPEPVDAYADRGIPDAARDVAVRDDGDGSSSPADGAGEDGGGLEPEDTDAGCRCGIPARTSCVVLGLNAAVLLAGLGMLLWRRR
jgi:hypothetical protein